MTGAAVVFVAVPRPILGLFTADASVITTGVALLLLAAVFQLFDGLQGVATGALRGLGDTLTPMLFNLAAHWLLGLPVGYDFDVVGVRAVALIRGVSSTPDAPFR